ncbi:hypothetical protein [Janthinobacterium violaceinigrum]|uniref:Uncharacterized protein n=1 Tax=Janthinobacterium violaceinigrum TaxID=2654252 RepID=A0A6I1I620_9BURK|nr:hypothetical protein [Janthinobacterium violaceinigrum]KAB8062967.1 hypothetical protein GCN75_20885 [Janthinobacterium violaceinigrum]
MQKPDQSIHLNKPFLLICLFTLSTLAATFVNMGDTQPADSAPAPVAPVARDAGHQSMPLCNSDAFKLSARCQPQPGRQA